MQKQGHPVGRDIIIQKAYEIHCHMFGSMRSVVPVVRGWCDQFMSQHGELTLRTAQFIKWARDNSVLEGLRRLFFKLRQHIIEKRPGSIVVDC